jgi:hypothetical protein
MPLLSSKMRDVLIDHLDGQAVPVVRPVGADGGEWKAHEGLAASRNADRHITTRALLARGFLKYNSNRAKAPTHTFITDAGRKELGALLGEYADALARARFEMPPTGDGAPTPPASHRRLAEAQALADAGIAAVDFPGGAHILGGKILPRTQGAADGDPSA